MKSRYDRPDDMVWPSNEDLTMFTREAAEHRRAWAFIAGLSKQMLVERRVRTVHIPKCSEHVARIRDLEAKVIGQKAMLRELETCRSFERESENLLVVALEKIIKTSDWHTMGLYARDAIAENLKRKGPRPAEVKWGPDSPGYDEMGQW